MAKVPFLSLIIPCLTAFFPSGVVTYNTLFKVLLFPLLHNQSTCLSLFYFFSEEYVYVFLSRIKKIFLCQETRPAQSLSLIGNHRSAREMRRKKIQQGRLFSLRRGSFLRRLCDAEIALSLCQLLASYMDMLAQDDS